MKKRNWSFFCALVGLALLLTACAAPVQGEGRLLEFPKTSWEMTPEEVMIFRRLLIQINTNLE